MSNIFTQLKEVGLKKNEAEIYLFLLQNGISTPPAIAKGTNIARTNCYNILSSLIEKDIVEKIQKGKREAFLARDPETLKLNIEKRLESIDRILPDLRATYIVQKNKPNFNFFEGWEEVKRLYEQSLEAKEIYAVGSTERIMSLDTVFFESYIKKIANKNIIFYDLLSSSSKNVSGPKIQEINDLKHSIKFLPEKYNETLTDILIWDDMVALIVLEEPVFGTLIKSRPLADTFRIVVGALRDLL